MASLLIRRKRYNDALFYLRSIKAKHENVTQTESSYSESNNAITKDKIVEKPLDMVSNFAILTLQLQEIILNKLDRNKEAGKLKL